VVALRSIPSEPETRPIAGTCPDCCGDVGVRPIEGGWVVSCLHCGVIVRGLRRFAARAEGARTGILKEAHALI
jgi:hypothetical protein